MVLCTIHIIVMFFALLSVHGYFYTLVKTEDFSKPQSNLSKYSGLNKDSLTSLRKNVLVERLIPAGTGFEGFGKYTVMSEFINELDRLEEYAKMKEGDIEPE